MKYVIITPSLNRSDLLEGLRQDVKNNTSAEHHVWLEKVPRSLDLLINMMTGVAVDSMRADIVVFLADHCRISANCWEELTWMCELYTQPTLVGIPILNVKNAKPTCFWAANIAYIEQFPNREVQCPEYYHFYGDTEMEIFAAAAQQLLVMKSGVNITHPNARNRVADATHVMSREYKKFDDQTFAMRQERNLVWGQTFETTGRVLPWLT